MKTKLGDIATVRTAMIFRESAPKEVKNGNVKGLTIRDLVADWPIDTDSLPAFELPTDFLDNCVTAGDVLIPSRGNSYPARYFSGSSLRIFPFGQINILTPNNQVSGVYLAWHLNQPHMQRSINQQLAGTSIKALNKNSLLNLSMEIPPLNIQYKIAKVQELWEKKKNIQEKLIAVEAKEIEGICRMLSSGYLSIK